MIDRYAVIGNPISHSKSPFIHTEFAKQTGQDLHYGTLLAPLDGFVAEVQAFIKKGGRGLNVTLPFKLEAFDLATEKSPRALDAGAINTLKFVDTSIIGDNTDGVGLVRDIAQNLAFPIRGKRVLLIGAGGAARGVIYPLLQEEPQSLTIANRTIATAATLVSRYFEISYFKRTQLSAVSFAELKGLQFDLIINASSASVKGESLPLPGDIFARGSLAYEMMYGKGRTPFMQFARDDGAGKVADGMGMLIEQAAESFLIWRGVRPDTRTVFTKLKNSPT
jgi:shikimate dehydrogenase